MNALLAEVRAFVQGLRGELPELFTKPPPPPPPPPSAPAGRFAERCAHFAAEMGVTYGKVREKDMSSLWGSCSARGDLSFNVRLLDAPPEVLDYVVVHELAHRRWRGHGRRFWDLVQKHCPEQKTHRRWLRKNGLRLLGELPGLGAADGEDAHRGALGKDVARQREVEAS